MQNFFIAIAVIFIMLIALYFTSRKRMIGRMKYLNGILNDKHAPDLFLKEIDKSIEKQRKALYKSTLNILKAKGLIWKGDWEGCVKLLNTVSPGDILNEFNSVMWHYNMIFALLNSDRKDEAFKLISDNLEFLNKNAAGPNKFISNPVKKIFALKDYYDNKQMKSEEGFNELNELQTDDFSKAINYYYLGKIDLFYGNEASADEKFQMASQLGVSSYLPELIKSESQGSVGHE